METSKCLSEVIEEKCLIRGKIIHPLNYQFDNSGHPDMWKCFKNAEDEGFDGMTHIAELPIEDGIINVKHLSTGFDTIRIVLCPNEQITATLRCCPIYGDKNIEIKRVTSDKDGVVRFYDHPIILPERYRFSVKIESSHVASRKYLADYKGSVYNKCGIQYVILSRKHQDEFMRQEPDLDNFFKETP